MKSLLTSLLVIVLLVPAHAQTNLVKNPSFEQHDTCPWLVDQIKIAKYWSCIDTAYVYLPADSLFFGNPNCSAEYINACAISPAVDCPHNLEFYQSTRTGNGMAHVYMYDNDTPVGPGLYKRDYILGHLYTPLTSGQSYCVTFYVVKSNNAGYAINHIGAYLDDGSIDTTSHCGWPQTQCTPQVLDTAIIEDTLGWTKIQGSFIANGTERYITIGNFSDAAHTATIRKTTERGSYYEVDDVSVIASNATAYAGPDVSIVPGDSTYIGVDSNGEGMPCYWYVLGGTSPIDSGGRIQVKPASTTSYVVVMDLCGNVTYDTVVVNVGPLRNVQVGKYGNVQIYPNPTTGSCTIQHAKGAQVVLYDLPGREVKRLTCDKDEEEVDLTTLPSGVYFVCIVDTITGEHMVRKVVKE